MSKLQPLGNDKGIKNKEYITPVTVQDAVTCPHEFMFRGTKVVTCGKCGWGLQVDSMEEFERIRDYYARRNAEQDN